MEFNDAGLNLLTSFEGLRLQAYWDVSHWAIGYGCGHHVTEGLVISQDEAVARLKEDIDEFSQEVRDLILPTKINDNQFSACVCLAYNIGIDNFARSTLLNCIKTDHISDAANEFQRWTRVKGEVCEGLVRRREAEKELYLSEAGL